jgi:hypothetical protein
LSIVAQSVVGGKTEVNCRNIDAVLIEALAPDLAMINYKGPVVRLGDIKKGRILGEDDVSKVYLAEWQNTIVVFRELKTEITERQDSLTVFNKFRKEICLLR